MKKSLFSFLLLTGSLVCSCENSLEAGFDSTDSASGNLRIDSEVIFENARMSPGQIELIFDVVEEEYWQNIYPFTVSGSGIINVKYRTVYDQYFISPSDTGAYIEQRNRPLNLVNKATGKVVASVLLPAENYLYGLNVPEAGSYYLSFDNFVSLRTPYDRYCFSYIIPVMYLDAVMVYNN